ncbi:MAG: tetratricopeptide repeat protein [Gemmatimonadota bacterium]
MRRVLRSPPRPAAVWAGLALVGWLTFANAVHNPFAYDDLHSIKYNPHIRSLAQVPRYFVDPHTFSSLRDGYMYRPLLLVSYAANHWMGGQDPAVYRYANLALHIACSGLLFHLALRLGAGPAGSLAAAFVFLLHPVHAEAVNYISARSDVAAALFYLAVLVTGSSGRGWVRGSGYAAYAAGLLTKSVCITAPGLLWAWDRLDRRRWTEGVRRYVGFGAMAAAYVGVLWAVGFLGSAASKAPRGLADNLWTQLKALVYYLLLLAMPVGLSVEHAFTVSRIPGDWVPALCAAVLGSATLVALWTARGRVPMLARGWSWYLVAPLPVVVVPLNILVSERRIYLASGGLVLVGAWAWAEVYRRRPGVAAACGAVALVALAALSYQRNAVWHTETGLWEEAVRQAPANPRAQLNLALALKRADREDEAMVHLQRGLDLWPDYADAYVVLGEIRSRRGDASGARAAFERAVALNPNLAGVYHNLGNLRMEAGDAAGAAALYEQALTRDPYFAEARNNLGQALESLGLDDRARVQYERAIDDSLYWTNTDDPVGGAWYNLARLCEKQGQLGRAAAAYARAAAALERRPQYAGFAAQAREAARRLGYRGGSP